jgi:esterase/lipase superfamily enzyme
LLSLLGACSGFQHATEPETTGPEIDRYEITGSKLEPNLHRPKEPLEAFRLEDLKLVAMVSENSQRHAIIKAANTSHRVTQGSYIGKNFGRVTDIKASGIWVRELVQDSSGDWMERHVILPLGDLADPQRVVPLEDHVVPILFSTNRKKSGINQPDKYFSDKEADSSDGQPGTLGRTVVRVPRKHKEGVLEQPGWIRLTLEKLQPSMLLELANVSEFKAEDAEQHFTFAYPIEELTLIDFHNDLKKLLGATKSRSALLFVHGYANSFKDAAYRTAQLSFDLRLEGYDTVPLLFSWPSDPGGINYIGAKDRIQSAGSYLATYLNTLVDATGSGVVHIIAHSMGADVLAVALANLGGSNLTVRSPDGRVLSKFHQIILAAPDIRAADFKKVIFPAIASQHRVTNYASSNDAALRLSRKGNAGLRAGDTDEGPIPVDGIETIDASAVNSEALGHSYFAESPAMIRDLRKLLRDDAKPEARGLTPVRRDTWTYWLFP